MTDDMEARITMRCRTLHPRAAYCPLLPEELAAMKADTPPDRQFVTKEGDFQPGPFGMRFRVAPEEIRE